MGKTLDLQNNLVTDLQSITTGNGYTQTVQNVSTEPVRWDEVTKFPHLALIPSEGGEDELETLGNQTGDATDRWTIQAVVNSSTPNADMEKLTDDIRNAVAKSTGSLVGTAGVIVAGVEDWGRVLTEQTIHGDTYIRELTVAVRYHYTRGSL